MKKRSERRKHCALAEQGGAKKFRTAADPLPRGAGLPKFNQLEMVTIPLPTNPVWLRSMHAISSYRGNRPKNPQTQNTQTHRQDRLQYTAPLRLARSVINHSNHGLPYIIFTRPQARNGILEFNVPCTRHSIGHFGDGGL